jgi:hypothetical protein
MTQAQLVRRIEHLEHEIAAVKKKLGNGSTGKTSRDFIGMFHNDPDFKEAMELGAAYRRSLRPGRVGKRARKK